MRFFVSPVVCLLLGLLILPVSASLKPDLQRLVDQLPAGTTHSILVRDIESGLTLFESGSTNNLVPASINKILTATVAYKVLGKDFRFKTQILAKRALAGTQSSNGSLVIRFSGDPSFTHDDLESLIISLRKKGLKEISGNLWLDGSLYGGYHRPGGTSWDDLNICFAAPVSAIILDRNCFFGYLKPASKEGRRAVMEYDHPEWLLNIDSRIVTRKNGADCVQEVWPSFSNEYQLSGCIDSASKPLRMAFSANNVDRATQRFVRALLRKNFIRLNGKIKAGKPEAVFDHVLAEHQSLPLTELLEPVLKNSDNIYADSILKTLGVHVLNKQGSFDSGIQAVRTILGEQGVLLERSRLVDGSGLSRYNSISAEDLVQVLEMAWRHWGAQAPWLKNREKSDRWLKTGYMGGIRNMAGYSFPDSNGPRAFTVILNGLKARQPANLEDRLLFRKKIKQFQREFLDRLSR